MITRLILLAASAWLVYRIITVLHMLAQTGNALVDCDYRGVCSHKTAAAEVPGRVSLPHVDSPGVNGASIVRDTRQSGAAAPNQISSPRETRARS
ncbi:MAG: hypothetical protein OES09_04105 [Gammaproteobacteria bacterium]|nr:hypothetical protein [Gammaproteobacteria bacterium]